MGSDEQKIVEHEGDNTYGKKPSFGQKLKRHYKRFWWVHLIILVIVVLIVTLPV